MSEYYRTKKFSQLTSTTIETLRHYDKIGLLKPSKKEMNGYKLYSDHDRLRLQQIMTLKFLSYPLDKIKSMILNKNLDIKNSLKEQATLLKRKSTVAKDAAWLVDQIIIQMERDDTPNWEMVSKITALLQLDEDDNENWQKKYYTQSEYNELAQATLRYPSEWWQDYYARWRALFKEVEDQLHIDPTEKIGIRLGIRWLKMKEEVPLSAEVQRKSWEALQKGIMPKESFVYNPKVIEFITKATKKYRELKKENPEQVAELEAELDVRITL